MEHLDRVTGGDAPSRRFGIQCARESMVRSLARALIVQAIFESQPQAHGVTSEMVAHCAAGF
jgi:hypothetical protein